MKLAPSCNPYPAVCILHVACALQNPSFASFSKHVAYLLWYNALAIFTLHVTFILLNRVFCCFIKLHSACNMLNSFPAVSSMYMNSALLNLSSDSLTIHVSYSKILLLPFFTLHVAGASRNTILAVFTLYVAPIMQNTCHPCSFLIYRAGSLRNIFSAVFTFHAACTWGILCNLCLAKSFCSFSIAYNLHLAESCSYC